MSIFTFLPIDPNRMRIEIEAEDPSDAFALLEAAQVGEVDVLVDGRYAFSCESLSDGSWLVFERSTRNGA
jgi:hypothetical protein